MVRGSDIPDAVEGNGVRTAGCRCGQHLAAAVFLEDDEFRLGRRQAQLQRTVLHVEHMPHARLGIPDPGLLGRHLGGEFEPGLHGTFDRRVDDEIDIPVARLVIVHHHKTVGVGDFRIRGQAVFRLQGAVPAEHIPLRGIDTDKTVGPGRHDTVDDRLHTGILRRGITESEPLVGHLPDGDHTSARRHEVGDARSGSGFEALDLHQQQGLVAARTEAEPAARDGRLADDLLADIVAAVAALLDGLPEVVGIGGIGDAGIGVTLHAVDRPKVFERRQDGDVGLIDAVLQKSGDTRLVIHPRTHIRPPRIVLVEISTELYPAEEILLAGAVIEAVEHRVVDARKVAAVARHLDLLERGLEDIAHVGLLFAAHDVAVGQKRSRRDELVDHAVTASRKVLVGLHHPADAVVYPRFAFGDVEIHRRFDGMELVAVSLHTRFEPVAVAPVVVDVDEVFLEELHLHVPEIVADTLDHVAGHLGRETAAVSLADGFAHGSGTLEHIGQERIERVTHTLLELGEHAGRPVVAFQLETVAERRADLPLEFAAGEMHRIGKFIEVTLHGLAVEVVHHGPAGARSPQDNTRIAVQLHEKVEDMFALGDIDRDGIVAGLVVVRNALGEMGDMLGHQADEQKLLGRVAAGIGHLGVGHVEHLVAADGKPAALDIDRNGIEHLHLLLGRKVFGAEGPARADDDVADHAALTAAVGSHVDHADPLVAQPCQRGTAYRIGGLVGELDGVDLHAADPGLVHHVQLAQDLLLVHTGAVPPPAHIGTMARVGISECFIQLFFGAESLCHGQLFRKGDPRGEYRGQ